MGKENKSFRETFKILYRFFRYMDKYRYLFLIMMMITLISTISYMIAPIVLSNGVNLLHEGFKNSNFDMSKFSFVIMKAFFVYCFTAILIILEGIIVTLVMNKVMSNIRKDIASKVHKLPLSYFDKHKRGEVMSVLTNDTETVYQNITYNMANMTSNLYVIVGMLVIMPIVNLRMAFVSWIGIALSLTFVNIISKKSKKYFKANEDKLATLNAQVEEIYSSYKIVKAFDSANYEYEKFEQISLDLAKNFKKANFRSSLIAPIIKSLGNLQFLIVVIFSMFMLMNGQILVGTVALFLEFIRMLNYPLMMISQLSPMIMRSSAALDRIFTFLDEPEETFDPSVYNVENDCDGFEIEFRGVDFGYDENIVIDNLNLHVPKASKIAIVGKTGAGKTTLVKLLMRFYKLRSGQIYIDGKDIESFDVADYRRMFGMVLQENWIFEGTIMENIKYSNDVSDEEVIEVCKKIKLHHFVKTLPDGYNTVIADEKDNLSTGQKQLVSVARIMLKNPKIMILDEATSSVDSVNERIIQEATDTLMHGKTAFVIAHRLSTVKNADLIIVVDAGKIVEKGTHVELLGQKGYYASLWNVK